MKNVSYLASSLSSTLILFSFANFTLAQDTKCVCNAPEHTNRQCGIGKPYYKVTKADCGSANSQCGGSCTYELFRDSKLTQSCGTITEPCGAPKPEPTPNVETLGKKLSNDVKGF
jgi:hypothetical protein